MSKQTDQKWRVARDITNGDFCVVETVTGGHVTDFVARPNAEKIVRAVNAHDALVALLRKVEWRGRDDDGAVPACPSCGRVRPDAELPYPTGHAADCSLALALAERKD